MRGTSALKVAGLSLLLAAVMPVSVAAQEPLSVDFRGGAAMPGGDLSDLMDTSPGFTVGVNLPLASSLDVRFQGGADLYSGKSIDRGEVGIGEKVANLSLTHGHAGLNYELIRPQGATGVTLDLYGGGGVTVAESVREEYTTGQGGTVIVDLSTVWPSADAGVSLGYQVSEFTNLFLSVQSFLVFSDEDETQDYTRLGLVGSPDGMSTIWSVPISAGVSFDFPG